MRLILFFIAGIVLANIVVATFFENARRYAIKMWQTTDDNRIERLMGEHFGRGYFTLDELRPHARTPLAARTKGTRVTAKPCAT